MHLPSLLLLSRRALECGFTQCGRHCVIFPISSWPAIPATSLCTGDKGAAQNCGGGERVEGRSRAPRKIVTVCDASVCPLNNHRAALPSQDDDTPTDDDKHAAQR